MASPLQRLQTLEGDIKDTLHRTHIGSTAAQVLQRMGEHMLEMIDILRRPFSDLDVPAKYPPASEGEPPARLIDVPMPPGTHLKPGEPEVLVNDVPTGKADSEDSLAEVKSFEPPEPAA